MKKALAALCLALTLLPFLITTTPLRASAQQAQPAQTNPQTLGLAGLRARVTIRRDERGIPYIEAANESDLYFAQGYVTASDRLFQMELLRRTARGELAEIFGAGPQQSVLESDKQHRRYGFAQLAESQAGTMPPKLREALEDYARGVNAYLESLDARSLPPEFQILQIRPRPWRVADSLVIGKLFDETLSTSWRTDLMRAAFADLPAELYEQLFPETSPHDVLVVGTDRRGPTRRQRASAAPQPVAKIRAETMQALAFDAEAARLALERVGLYARDNAASNNWVVSGRRTLTGKPLLANDPHLSASAPSIWYMAHLSAPDIRVAGVSVAGLPGIAIGHNEQIAWGVTSLEPDVQDLYVEKFDQENARRYMTPTGWREAEVRREEIKVRKSPAGTATETVPLEVTVTRHGPIVFEKDGKRYALRWTALAPDANLAESFYLLNTARNWTDFRAALRNYPGPAFNMIYADVHGHIGYYGTGRFPIRKTGAGKLPYDGSTDEGEWTSFIPFDAMPQSYDPPGGIIVTANSRIVGLSYPYKLTVTPLAAYRARRIYDLLQAKQKLSVDDFRSIQGDTYSISGTLFAREVAQVTREDKSPASKYEKWLGEREWQAALSLFTGWDGRVIPESSAALLISHMRDAFRRRVIAAKVGTERAKLYSFSNSDTLIDRLIKERPADWLPKEFKSYAELLRACLAEAREELMKDYGADESKWIWGREAQVRFPHPLAGVPLVGQRFAIAPFPQNGSQGSLPTVNRGSSVSMRLIADLSDWDRTQQGIALGVSGLPSSPHWKDQLEDWRNVTPRTLPFTAAAVASAARETLLLEPAK
ncbi:MAG TPA: penicillin acylase family protein [Pyrinomonadaceae bacterium]|nr:penicillin acylase family protein [Pyrinomonadaceae bacterium]